MSVRVKVWIRENESGTTNLSVRHVELRYMDNVVGNKSNSIFSSKRRELRATCSKCTCKFAVQL